MSRQTKFSMQDLGNSRPPLQIIEATHTSRSRSWVVRFLQTQNFFRSKQVEVFAPYVFRGFWFTILVVRLISHERVDDFEGIYQRLDGALQSTDITRTNLPHHTLRKVKCQDWVLVHIEHVYVHCNLRDQ